MARLLVFIISFTVRILRAAFRSRADLVTENVALRQQVATLLKQRIRPTVLPEKLYTLKCLTFFRTGFAPQLFK